MSDRIFLSSPYMCGKELEYVTDAFETNWIAPLGPHVNEFEKEIASYVNIKSAAALSSGTAAIHLALKYLDIGMGDIVFCSSLTFAATCNPIIYQNAIPVFIDSEPNSWNMSPIALKKAFEKHIPKAVIVVNLYGQSADMDPIITVCQEYGVPIIEDAAESLGATYKGKPSGTFGKFGIYSFNGNKIITTSGGGMLVSEDDAAIQKSRFWATQSRDPERHYQHTELGYNYRMSNVCAAIGRGQLTAINDRIIKKKQIYDMYNESFERIKDIQMMPICNYGEPNYWLSCITIEKDSKVNTLDIMDALENENIESRPIWKPMQLQPYWSKYDFFSHHESGISVSEDIFDKGVCLPSDAKITKDDQQKVIDIIKRLWNKSV